LVLAVRRAREGAYRLDGHTTRTLVREPAMRIVLLVMRAGAKIAEHRSQDTASIHALAGHVRLMLPIAPWIFRRQAPRDRAGVHDVEAVADSAFLLTLARSGLE
jgi:hypothetical protein